MSEHTKGLLATFEVGNNGNLALGSEDKTSLFTIVDEDGTDFAALYHAADAKRLAACWNLLDGYNTKEFEGVSLAEFVDKQQPFEAQQERQREHELRVRLAGELETSNARLNVLLEKLHTEFPIFQEDGLDEEQHCCESTLLNERKRLHMTIFGVIPTLCGGCGVSGGGKCPDCGPVMGHETYQEMFGKGEHS